MRRRCVLVLAVFAALLAGCSMPRPVVTATSSVLVPSVSSVTTPSVDPVYEEAERVVLKLGEIDRKYLYSGNYQIYPREEMAQYSMDPFLTDSEKAYEIYRRDKITVVDADKLRREFKPFPEDHSFGTEVTLIGCLDLSPAKVFKNGTPAPEGGIYRERYYFKHDGAVLKLFRIHSEKVTKCELD